MQATVQALHEEVAHASMVARARNTGHARRPV